jgi:hypothetical protein
MDNYVWLNNVQTSLASHDAVCVCSTRNWFIGFTKLTTIRYRLRLVCLCCVLQPCKDLLSGCAVVACKTWRGMFPGLLSRFSYCSPLGFSVDFTLCILKMNWLCLWLAVKFALCPFSSADTCKLSELQYYNTVDRLPYWNSASKNWYLLNYVSWVRERTILTERPPLVG